MPYYYYSFLSKMHFWTLCGLLAASTPPGRVYRLRAARVPKTRAWLPKTQAWLPKTQAWLPKTRAWLLKTRTPNAPLILITHVLPHQTHLGAKNALLLLQYLIKSS